VREESNEAAEHNNTALCRLLPPITENKKKKWCHCLPNVRLSELSDGDCIFSSLGHLTHFFTTTLSSLLLYIFFTHTHTT